MYHSIVKILWIYILCIVLITGKGKCNADVVCATTGFNATLQWTLDLDEYRAKSSTINVFNESGISIAQINDRLCETVGNHSVYCEKLNTTEKWIFKMVLINVTPANTGKYTCQITSVPNTTNITKQLIVRVSSSPAPIPEHGKDSILELTGLGLVIAGVFMVIAGILIIEKIRHYRNVKLVSRTLHQRSQEQVNNKASDDILSFEKINRLLPFPQQQINSRRNPLRSDDPNIHRKSMSVPRLAGYTEDNWAPNRMSVSLQTLIQLSQTVGRFTNNDDMVITNCSSNEDSWFGVDGFSKGIRRMELYSKDTNAACFVYDYAATNELEQNQKEGCGNTGARNYIYDYAVLPGQQKKENVVCDANDTFQTLKNENYK